MSLSALVAAIILAGVLSARDSYFPNGALSDYGPVDAGRALWYSAQLRALDEPSLFEKAKDSSTHSYRLLWLRTFGHPVTVRLDVMIDGTGKLTVKMSNGAGGYNPGKLIKNISRSVTQEQTGKFLEKIKALGFWELPSYEKTSG